MQRVTCWAAVLLMLVALALPVGAQDTTVQRGVRIGLVYRAGTKPSFVVLPVRGPGGDSIQAILERDFDYSDRIEVIRGDNIGAMGSAQLGSGALNYGAWASLGAAALVQVTLEAGGGAARVALHDVTQRRVVQAQSFPLPPGPGSEEWRMAVHGIADEVERWTFGVRGIAQTRILYVRGGRIYVIDSDGAGEQPVTEPGTVIAPAWHPSGRYVAYSQLGPRGWDIRIRDLATGATRTLPSTPGGLNTTPAFSPDGNSIVYAHGEENGTDLYLTSAFGNGPARRITVGRGTDNISPSFSPDGGRLAFTSGRLGHPEVYTADVDGSNVELLTPFNFGDQNYRSNPDWSPDGRLIAFQSQINGQFQVMTITLRDRSVKQLTSEGINEDPSWAPDGRHLVFTSTRTGVKELFVLDTESGRTRQLTHSAGARLGAWSRYLDHAP
jgi:TolB protein